MKTNTKGLVVTPSLSQEAGAVVFWDLAGVTDSQRLADAFSVAGLPASMLPLSPSPETCLRRAVESACGGATFKRKAKVKNVWIVVTQKEDKDAVDFDVTLDVGLDALGRLIMEPPTGAAQDKIRASYEVQTSGIPPEALSTHLCHVVARLDGVALRQAGGFYFVPRASVGTWRNLASAVRDANSGCALRSIPAMPATDVIEAVAAAVVRESETVIADLAKVPVKSEKGRSAKIAECNATIEKVARYETLLGTKLTQIRDEIEKARLAAATAMLQTEE